MDLGSNKNYPMSAHKTVLYCIQLCIVLLYSCSSKSDKIGVLIASKVFEQDCNLISSKVKSAGFEVIWANANNDDKIQITQAEDLINAGAKVMVLIPVNTNTAAMIVRKCNENHVKVISYERIVSNCKLDYFISFDNILIGELIAKAALKRKPQGNYMILSGDKSDRNAVWVHEGFLKALSSQVNSKQVSIVYDSFIEDWSVDNAKYEFKKFVNLSGSVPDVILSAWNGMNDGIFYVLDERTTGEYPVVGGQDADSETTRKSLNKKQAISLFKSYRVEAEATVDLALKLIENKKVTTNKTINNGSIDVPSIVLSQMEVLEIK